MSVVLRASLMCSRGSQRASPGGQVRAQHSDNHKNRYYNAQSTDQSINTMLNICTSHEANTNSPRAHTGLTPVGGTLPSHKTSCLYTQSAKLQFIYQFSGHKDTYTKGNVV